MGLEFQAREYGPICRCTSKTASSETLAIQRKEHKPFH